MVETLETATSWSNLKRLHDRVGRAIAEALQACGTPGLVMCHVSHLYETGASLYFTFLAARRAEDEIGQWRTAQGSREPCHLHRRGHDHPPSRRRARPRAVDAR